MKSIFLAHWFGPKDAALTNSIEDLLTSHDMATVTGKVGAGNDITDEVKAKIVASDGLIALLTRREQIKGRKAWRTHPWVEFELACARLNEKPAIAVYEKGVDVSSIDGGHERLEFDRKSGLPWIRLSETVGEWKRRAGRTEAFCILPDELVGKLGVGADVSFRVHENPGAPTRWQPAAISPEPGGAFIYVPGLREGMKVQVRIQKGAECWESVATPPWRFVKLIGPTGG